MRGIVNGIQPTLMLRMKGADNRFEVVHAIVDTGFDGWLSLPPNLIADMGLPWKSEGIGMLADGRESRFDIFAATVQWHGRARRVSVYGIGVVPLIGMALLKGSEYCMKVRHRGAVTIKPLRRRRR